MTLTPKQQIYCQDRAVGASSRVAAERAGVTPKTASEWNQLPAIDERIEEIQAPIRKRVMQKFRASAERAAERIIECVEPGYNLGNSADTNLKAAALVLKFAEMEPATKTQLSGDPDAPLTIIRKEFV